MQPERALSKFAALVGIALAALLLTAGAASAQEYDPCDGYDPGGVYDGYDPPDECVDDTTTTTTTTAATTTTVDNTGGGGLPVTGGVTMAGFGVVLAAGAIALRRMNSAV